jgi:hypothetical protein
MALAYRTGFVRDVAVTPPPAAATTGAGSWIAGFLRAAADLSLCIDPSTVGATWQNGFLRTPAGKLCAVQEATADILAPTITTYYRNGFLREVGTDRVVWVIAPIANMTVSNRVGFARSQFGHLVLV